MHDYKRAVENKHLNMNKNNKNTKGNVKTQNRPYTSTGGVHTFLPRELYACVTDAVSCRVRHKPVLCQNGCTYSESVQAKNAA